MVPNTNSAYNGHGDDYFYHKTWPEEVHICVESEHGELTYMLSASNTKKPLSVTKTFSGSQNAARPGTYTFGIWSEATGADPQPEDKLETISITYDAADFGQYTVKKETPLDSDDQPIDKTTVVEYIPSGSSYQAVTTVTMVYSDGRTESSQNTASVGSVPSNAKYGLFPTHEKTADFSGSLTHGTYYIYELNDEGYPITESGTVGGTKYSVSLSGDSAVEGYKVVYDGVKNDVTVTNQSYTVEVEKQFLTVSGAVAERGFPGTYRFAIWNESDIGTDGLPTTEATISNTIEITWGLYDLAPSQKAVFSGLHANTQYRVYELDSDNQPVANSDFIVLNGVSYCVRYDGTDTTVSNRVTTADTQPIVTVGNQGTVALPHTGGLGTQWYTAGGLLLMLGSLLWYAVLHRRKAKEQAGK